MIIDIKKKAADKKISLPDLITRPIGRKMYECVSREFAILGEEEVVFLDFAGIKVIDSSFIDEFLIKLILDSRMRTPAFFIKLINISDIAEINIDSVFNSYYMYNNDKIAVITDRLAFNNSYFIGTLSKTEKNVIDYLKVNKAASPEEAASIIDKSVEETGKILEELYHLRVVRRGTTNKMPNYIAL